MIAGPARALGEVGRGVGKLLVAYRFERSIKMMVIACNAEIIRPIDVHNANMCSGKLEAP